MITAKSITCVFLEASEVELAFFHIGRALRDHKTRKPLFSFPVDKDDDFEFCRFILYICRVLELAPAPRFWACKVDGMSETCMEWSIQKNCLVLFRKKIRG